ncbi:MAG: four helix bundle protein [Candidatus Omnitrophica bacterium]|nr:four helix bundle protein [Candidatus Omnitrophota bacterium]
MKIESREMEKRSIKSIDDFDVYQKAVRLFNDFIGKDLPVLQKSFIGRTLAGNQLRSLDSVCANMEEGYERKSGKEIKIFLEYLKVLPENREVGIKD